MIKSLTPLISFLLLFQYENEKNEKSKGRLIQNPKNYDIPSLPLHTSERTILIVIEINALSHLLNPKWLGRGKVPWGGTPGNRSSGDGVGPVAQRIRARGYEPRCRGFESLLAHNRPRGKGTSPLGVGKYRDSGPKAMELGCGSFVEIECFFLFLVNEGIITHSMPGPFSLFFCFTSLNSSSAGLGQNSGASTTN